MNREEKTVFDHLKSKFGESIVFEPDGNIPPDILIDNQTAVEVRRLNQHFFDTERIEGLEKLSYPLFDAFKEVLKSFGIQKSEIAYWVFIDYKRPLRSSIHDLKKKMKEDLKLFLQTPISAFPYILRISNEVEFIIHQTQSSNKNIFRPGGGMDDDAGGWVVQMYIENIRHCITEKTEKTNNYLSKYNRWWLYLVDNMMWGLDKNDIKEITENIQGFGNFEKISIIGNEKEYLSLCKS